MKRRTNLFYESGNDSKFITFSNYTESLTGNFLSTDTKIFPSRFLCLKINGLNAYTKPVLIKYLTEYYENKLAVLRDKYLNDNKNVEHNIYPLNYLLEALFKIKSIDNNNGIIHIAKTPLRNNGVVEITYVSDITEQDYNGTYTDTICIVNLNNVYSGEIHIPENVSDVNDKDIQLSQDEYCSLYGWNDDATINQKYLPLLDDVKFDYFTDFDENYYVDHYPNVVIDDDTHVPENHETNDAEFADNYFFTGLTIDGYYLWKQENEHSTSSYDWYLVTDSIDLSSTGKNDSIIGKMTSDDEVYESNDVFVRNAYIREYSGDPRDAVSTKRMLVFDKSHGAVYHVNSYIDYIKLTHEHDANELQFNCIIPLFDVVDINYKSNSTPIEEIMMSVDEDKKINLIDEYQNNMYTKNVPLGMWLNADEESDTFVTLKRADTRDFSPSWSLVISSQFKPFPYSDSMPDDFTTNSMANSFATFAEVLSRQNEILDSMKNLSYQMNYMHNRITNLEGQIKQLGTSYNIDGIHNELIDYERMMNDKFEVFRNDINSYVANFKWRTIL